MFGARIRLFGIDIDKLSMAEAIDTLDVWLATPRVQGCRYVVTPNVDHVVQLRRNEEFVKAYEGASLVLADGWPVVSASRLVGKSLPEVVPGSSLIPEWFSTTTRKQIRVFLLGAPPGVADVAANNIRSRWKGVAVVGTYSPRYGFERDERECAEIVQRINDSGAEVVLIGLGAPKQELWVAKHSMLLNAKIALCVGATIDFLAGTKSRAPEWVRDIRLEWAHRLMSEPGRLWRRYAYDALVFPYLTIREFSLRGRR